MEDIMLIQSGFLRSLISRVINKVLKKKMPGMKVELKTLQANWSEKDQKAKVHLELDAEVTKAQLIDILENAGLL